MTNERHQKTKQANASYHKMLITDITLLRLLTTSVSSNFFQSSQSTVIQPSPS